MSDLPFTLEKVEDFGIDWIPEKGQEYLIEHSGSGDKKSVFMIGRFNKVRDRFWNFHWYWGGGSFQFNTEHPRTPNQDWERFKNVWKFHRNIEKNLIDEKEMEI